MKKISSKEIIKILEKNGWYLHSVVGSHHHFKHPTKEGKVTVPHPRKDLKIGTQNSILKQAGLK
ncbi:type II toxin-antitoxin system HicA family toxin [Rummeliibacillus sp. SL167]|uniref:type II toxin-antitoxin system HicA family toxin n=1 Tax=Rummeliibacillus sp. SL167 TaxID=2579792 RepID=UPI0016465171|nr:type II toxin-antitoxin system HicA family toxin [Rummeliibacillus sp. SL167]